MFHLRSRLPASALVLGGLVLLGTFGFPGTAFPEAEAGIHRAAGHLPAGLLRALASGNPAALASSRLPRLGDLTAPQVEELAGRLKAWPTPRRVAAFAFLMVGTPYVNGPLGEESPPDTDPIFAARPADCATVNLVATTLAHVPESGTPREAMRWTNYRDGRVDYASRLHFTTDRLDASPFHADITARVGGTLGAGITRSRTVVLNRKPDGTRWIPIDWERTRTIHYIPREHASRLSALHRSGRLPDAVGVAFVSERMMDRGLDVIHESLLWQGRTLLHGSSAAGRVTTIDFGRYLDEQRSRVDGVVIFEYR